jgi:3-hydroxyisobutyrate dehydrogenase-like beta-hydroxyacid dehydrogenase
VGRESKVKIGFVGLGKMGRPMAMNLVKSGAELVVHATTDESYSEFRAAGALATYDLSDVAGAQTIFLSLPGSDAVKEVLLGARGLVHHLSRGQTIVDTSTITFGATLEVANALERRGVEFLDAPVSGMEARAIDGTLTVMCGGKPDVFHAVKGLLETLGNQVLYMGPVGSGQLTKLVNQLLFDINCAALAEILPMAAKMGLDSAKVGAVVNSGTGRSYASEFFIPRILGGQFEEGYPMRDAYKDLVSAAEFGAALCIPMPVLAAATATYQTALLQGHGAKGKGGMVRVFEDLLDVRFRQTEPTHKTP